MQSKWALRGKKINNFVELWRLVASRGYKFWVSWISFQKNNISWTQQPPTEKSLKFNLIFHDSTKINFVSKHQNKAGRDLAKTYLCATCKKETNDVKPRNVLYGTFLINQSVSVWCSNTGVLHRLQLWLESQVMPRPSVFFVSHYSMMERQT